MGYLKLIIGPMFAGKSTEIIRLSNNYKVINKVVLPINHIINSRYESDQIVTHNNCVLDGCIIVESLQDVEKNHTDAFKNADVILIEELQFFKDAFEMIVKWVDVDGKTVIAAGLDGDAYRMPFGDVLRLIPYADTVNKVSALCKKCGDGTPAIFSKKLANNKTEQIRVGSSNIYEAVCRKHYLE
tara:strand:+ start:1039 stop:1593 length:555 start_codon:yes stop_codon:yes gene_type:complete